MSNDDIKEIYKEFIEELEFTPSYDFCQSVYRLPSPKTVLRRFNCTWNEFIMSLGFTPNEQKLANISYAKDGGFMFILYGVLNT